MLSSNDSRRVMRRYPLFICLILCARLYMTVRLHPDHLCALTHSVDGITQVGAQENPLRQEITCKQLFSETSWTFSDLINLSGFCFMIFL